MGDKAHEGERGGWFKVAGGAPLSWTRPRTQRASAPCTPIQITPGKAWDDLSSRCAKRRESGGFHRLELVSNLAGDALYRACAYAAYENIVDDRGGAGIPLLRMKKSL